MVLIICGMPKSGINDLAYLLNIREEEEVLPYKIDRVKLRKKLGRIKENNLEGDIGHYYLNYLEELLKIYNAKVIVLKRNKKEVMRSMKDFGWNPYSQRTIKGSEAFPYHCKNIDTATGYYYDEYYDKVNKMKTRFPNKVLILDPLYFDIDKIFDFLDIAQKDRKYKKRKFKYE